jgi:hypothetical protein
MTNDQDRPRKLAILIDADNASPRILKGLFEEVASIGEASVRRIYGDFSGARLKCWADVLSGYAIVPHQNFSNTTGKNASDIALVIDAMDLLHTGRIDGFCLVSSDSDFTRLASRIREQGIDVYGFGERKTPDSFRKGVQAVHLYRKPAANGQAGNLRFSTGARRPGRGGIPDAASCGRHLPHPSSAEPVGRSERVVFPWRSRPSAPGAHA